MLRGVATRGLGELGLGEPGGRGVVGTGAPYALADPGARCIPGLDPTDECPPRDGIAAGIVAGGIAMLIAPRPAGVLVCGTTRRSTALVRSALPATLP